MSRSFRLTRRAEASLVEIARWTIETFGIHQADLYEAELLDRCKAILAGQAHSRSCSILLDGAADLRFVRAGEHFVVVLDRPDEVIIVDFLHSRSDLPRHVAALAALKNRARRPRQSPSVLERLPRKRSRRRWWRRVISAKAWPRCFWT